MTKRHLWLFFFVAIGCAIFALGMFLGDYQETSRAEGAAYAGVMMFGAIIAGGAGIALFKLDL